MEQLETISVVPHKERHDDAKPASPSWFVAKSIRSAVSSVH